MKKYVFIIFLMVFPSTAWADDMPVASLFFTSEEVHQAEKLAEKTMPPGMASIHLGAVMYYGPEDWVLWMQGEKWTPQTAREDLHVLHVTANEVRLSWRRDKDSPAREITLTPNQTYQIATEKITAAP